MRISIHIKLLILAMVFFFFNCTAKEPGIKDLIKSVTMISGVQDSLYVSDLFYAKDYSLTFDENENFEVDYKKSNGYVYIKPANDFEGFSFITFSHEGEKYQILIKVRKLEEVKFSFKPEKDYKFISLFGSFNSWNRENLEMKDNNNDGVYEITVPFEPGSYEYKFYGDGEEITDPNNPDKISNGMGSYNSILKIEAKESTKLFLHLLEYTGNKLSFYVETDDFSNELNKSNVFVLNENQSLNDISIDGKTISVNISSISNKGIKSIRAALSINGVTSNIQQILFVDGKPANELSNNNWYDANIYSLMIDRFNDGDTTINNPIKFDSLEWKANYMGGDLQGIINKLNDGYFDSLNINTIWISPVYDNPNEPFREYPAPHRYYSGYHGYWPISPNKVEEKFGTMDNLKELVATAHKHDIKILLDFVSNHVHEEHPYFKDHREWFGELDLPDGTKNLRRWDEYRLTTWFEPYLPSFDFPGSEEAVKEMVDNAIWWLEETNADGFRHDAVKHVPNEFWRALTKEIKEKIEIPRGVKVYQIGETFGDYNLVSSYVNNGQLSSQFNFNLYNIAQAVFIEENNSFANLDIEIKKNFDVYGPIHFMGNIMDSHDKNRYMAYADGDLTIAQWSASEEGWNDPPNVDNPSSYDKAELYYAYMFSIPGLPVVYYGSEFGMTGASDPDNRRMMRFDDQLSLNEKNMLKNVREISKLRAENSALRYGDFYTLIADENVYAYSRSDANQRVIVILNKSENQQKVSFKLPEFYNAVYLEDLANGNKYPVERDNFSVIMDGISYKYFVID